MLNPFRAALWLALASLALFISQPAGAQTPAPPVPIDLALVETTGIFGQPVTAVRGRLRNVADGVAFSSISVRAEVYNASGEVIGEGFGTAVDECGATWGPAFALPPEATTGFDVQVETFAEGTIRRAELFVEAESAPVAEPEPLPDGIRRLADGEVIEVEWIDARRLRFAIGCERLPFTEWAWAEMNVQTGRATAITHPQASAVTEALRARIGAASPEDFEHAFIRFTPAGDRLLYQDRVNTLLSATADGAAIRQVMTNLFNRTLQRITWGSDDRFLATYFGGFGDPVLYYTATARGQRISPTTLSNRASQIVPGISRDANRAIIAGDFADGLGYYLVVFNNNFFDKLFDATPPGNNYPAPIPIVDATTGLVTRVYAAIDDDDGAPALWCFNREVGTLTRLAPLPFRLAQEESAVWWLAPDDATVALAANGVGAGLWHIDLAAMPECS